VGNPNLALFGLKLTVYDWIAIGVIILIYSIALLTTFIQARQLAQADAQERKQARR
jgi:uncharacterized membrane protein YqhA